MASVLLAEDKPQEAEPLVLGANAGTDKELQDMQRGSLVNVGAVYLQGKRYADAQRMFEEVVRRFPASNWGAYGQGRVLQEQGKHGDAVPLFERATAMEKPFAAMYLRLAQSYKALGEKIKAIAAAERSLAFKPALASKQRKEAEALLAELK
jgi:predicted Zn-dependent protease